MPSLYGQRWKIVDGPPFGSGGQAEVFRVIDTTGDLTGEYALKRVKNPKRRARFLHEVQAIRELTHTNIVPLIDHSALEDQQSIEKQFLVMPVAKGGDLGREDVLRRFQGSVDSVLAIAEQLADALAFAHKAGVIHRDLKPQNVLLKDDGDEVWLADFGICLIRASDRITETGEIVGPVFYMAPELEGGIQLDVTPAADVYSLGKVIYFLFTGGVTLPRERIDEDQYSQILKSSERERLLLNLLRKMICPAQVRIKSMSEILVEVQKIRQWENTTQLTPLNALTRDRILRIQDAAARSVNIASRNKAIKQSALERQQTLNKEIQSWLILQLGKVKSELVASDAIDARLEDPSEATRTTVLLSRPANILKKVGGVSLSFAAKEAATSQAYTLTVLHCIEHSGLDEMFDYEEPQFTHDGLLIPRDEVNFLIPVIFRGAYYSKPQVHFPISVAFPQNTASSVAAETFSFEFRSTESLTCKFRTSEWPETIGVCNDFVRSSLDAYFLFSESC